MLVPSPRAGAPFALAAALLAIAMPAPAQVSPEESARQLKPADGLEATLWAAEPMVVNPTTIDVDSRGRVWVTEGLNYRLTRGGNRQFSRIEEADRIKILEDTDNDGRADKVTVFADRIFPVPMGIAVEERYDAEGKYRGCKVYIGNSPNLLVLEDTDGDDRADKRYPLLTGFGGIDSDHGVHGMVFGPDGKLYFTHGDGCCSVQPDRSEKVQNFDVTDASGRHVWSDQLANTLRVNRDGTEFEILADRQRNNYETCLNSFGNGFTSDNDDDGNRGCRVIWIMDGGHYGYRTPGSPRHWGEEVPGNVPKLVGTGNGSPCGIMVYEGTLLPEPYRGGIFEVDAGTRLVNFFPLTRRGAAFRTEAKVLLASDDPWFRPVDAAAGPDGSVYVPDWYDGGVGGHAFRDQTTGRIYRVRPKGARTEAPKTDFGTLPGLIAGLQSPVVATRDAAFRGLVARGEEAVAALRKLDHGARPEVRARALWVRAAIQGAGAATVALKDADPRLREQAVRILGRDCRENGHVEYARAEAKQPPVALAHLDVLLPMADDLDAGVRRELILALRQLPTEKVEGALRKLAASWDGQDRWYLEALGLALRDRDSAYLADLFDGHLYGPLDLDSAGRATGLALPPYFPVDRNEAFLAVGDKDLPASALTKSLGLMWEVHSAEVLPLLSRILPELKSPELQQAADDVLAQVTDPAGAVALAGVFLTNRDDPIRRRQFLAALGRRLDGPWAAARNEPQVVEAITAGLAEESSRGEALATAAATGDTRYVPAVLAILRDGSAPAEARVAAVEALARLKAPEARPTLEGLIAEAVRQGGTDPLAQAAVRSLPRLGETGKLPPLVTAPETPLGLRREAMRTLIASGGGPAILDLAEKGQLPDELKSEATISLNSVSDRGLRDRAARVLPLPRTAGGKPLPPFFELVRSDGEPARGREVFFKAASEGAQACGACHRVQGRGQWVGPDLSTIGTKYGKDELLRSILTPSAAIGYNYRALTVATRDGRVLTGLPVEESADGLVLKTAVGERVAVRAAEVEEKRYSEVSLMPEGLAELLGEKDLVDLLAFLATLKQPVSILGQVQAAGPVPGEALEPGAIGALDPSKALSAGGQQLPWRRLTADAEGRVNLAPLTAADARGDFYLHAPITSAAEHPARLVVDSTAPVRAWLGGREVAFDAPRDGQPRSASVPIPRGTTSLVLRVPAGAAVVTTFIADRPLEFSPAEAAHAAAR